MYKSYLFWNCGSYYKKEEKKVDKDNKSEKKSRDE